MHSGYCLLVIINDSVSYLISGVGARDLPMEEQELPTGRLKWPENAVFVHHLFHFAKFPPTETRNFLRQGS